ncbi:MAG: carboxypeptidase regulatory-like domain-containing protein [bacterium]|nr:carboxypeptidase regulatory-like domain-containing protein [bacterium]
MLRHLLLSLILSLAAPTLPAAAEIFVAGKVLAPGGKPRVGVEVTLVPIVNAYERAMLRRNGHTGPEPVARAVTDEKGVYRLDAPDIGMWKVVVTAPGSLAMELRLTPLLGESGLPDVELRAADELEVRITDPTGKPKAAAIGMFDIRPPRSGWRSLLRLARAGEDGIARLPRGRGEKVRIEAVAVGHPYLRADIDGPGPATLRLTAGNRRTVRVTGARKKPLPDVLALQGSWLLPLDMSDAEGLLELVIGEPSQVWLTSRDGWSIRRPLDFSGAPEEVLTIALEPPRLLEGRVVDVERGDPVADALVWTARGEGVRSDVRGLFELPLTATSRGFVRAAARGFLPSGARLPREPGQTVAITLTPAAEVSGTVVDVDGNALEGVDVTTTNLTVEGPFDPSSPNLDSSTNRRGTFEITGLPAGCAFELLFEKPGYAPKRHSLEPLEPFEQRSGLEIVLRPGRLAFGRVVDEQEVPVGGASVQLVPQVLQQERVHYTRQRKEPEPRVHGTDAEGRYEIRDLEAGRYDLKVEAAGYAPAAVPGVQVKGGREIDLGTLTLLPGATVELRVRGGDDSPVAGAEVWSRYVSRAPERRGVTDAEGHLEIRDLQPGHRLPLTVEKQGFSTVVLDSVEVPTEEPIGVVLRRAARISGRVVDARRGPIVGANVWTSSDEPIMGGMMLPKSVKARTGEDGAFVLENVEPGRVSVYVRAASFQRALRSGIELSPGGERADLEIVLEPGAVVEGTVTDAEGRPVIRAVVSVRIDSPYFTSSYRSSYGTSDTTGHYRIDGVPLGKVMIHAQHDDRQQTSKTVEIVAGTQVVDLVFEAGFEVAGVVYGPDGTPLAGVNVTLQRQPEPGSRVFFFGSRQVVTGTGGGFAMRDVPAGTYVLGGRKSGLAEARPEPFEVTDADVRGLELHLGSGVTMAGRVLGLELDELASLALTALGGSGGGAVQGRVDYEARYVIEGLTPGTWQVKAEVGVTGRMALEQVEIEDGVTEAERDIEFRAGFTISGLVTVNGEPMPNATVIASRSGGSGQAFSDTSGRYRIDHLMAGSHRLWVLAGAGFQYSEEIEVGADGEVNVEIFTGSVAGTVRDAADGRPLAGARVSLERLQLEDDSVRSRQLASGGTAGTDSEGRFRLGRVREGGWRLRASKDGYVPAETTLEVTAGGELADLELLLTSTESRSR